MCLVIECVVFSNRLCSRNVTVKRAQDILVYFPVDYKTASQFVVMLLCVLIM